jgi:hypothetical protein
VFKRKTEDLHCGTLKVVVKELLLVDWAVEEKILHPEFKLVRKYVDAIIQQL